VRSLADPYFSSPSLQRARFEFGRQHDEAIPNAFVLESFGDLPTFSRLPAKH